jgi:uncharacterized protein (TIGR03437 family)
MTLAAMDGRIASAPLAALLQATTVRIGGVIAPVTYAGAAPGLVNGMLQINATVPDGVTPGDAVPIEITIGDITSPTGVTLAVR